MIRSFVTRIALLVATVLVASTTIFALIHLSGDPTRGFLPPGASPEVREAVRARLGLDQPLYQQYTSFLADALRGDFGDSWRDRQPALQAVLDRLPATLTLTAVASTLAVVIGGVMGVASAWIRSRRWSQLVVLVSLLGQAVPAFWLGTLLILVFAVRLEWVPSSWDGSAAALILPTVALAAYPASMIARLLHANLQDVAAQPFVQTAHGKGLPARLVVLRHSLPNAALPALAYLGVQIGFLLGGAVVVESVFAYPGIGRLALQSAAERDLPVVHAFVVVTATLIGLTTIAIDLIAALIDPRLRHEPGRAVAHG